ncbi:MAG: FYVE zinc finger domain-containing protein [Planctomycetota bacterium]|nr:FYVE zinc finger domain-containing protein [Planctomycetota bacterium]
MPGTRYDRLLDVHLVSSKVRKWGNVLAGQKGGYQYDFQDNVVEQRNDYKGKLKAKFRADVQHQLAFAAYMGMGMMGIPGPTVQQARPAVQQAQTLSISHVLGSAPSAMPNLEPLHYVTCYVDLESLRPAQPLLAEFDALVRWVSALQGADGKPKVGKLRLNCHGAGTSDAGLLMGESNLQPEELVDALIRHGLRTRSRESIVARRNPIDTQGRWKNDDEVRVCESCRKEFTMLTRRRHHCRRCGGIFCDACTKQRRTVRDPLSENGRVNGEVKDCRVCDRCATLLTEGAIAKARLRPGGNVQAGRGLVQITLAMCLAARTQEEYSVAKTGFVRNSVGSRIAKQLSLKDVEGIKVSASNEVVSYYQGRGLKQIFGVKYPGMSGNTRPQAGLVVDPFEGTGFAGFVDVAKESVRIPNSVLGASEANPAVAPIINDLAYREIQDQKIVPIHGGNAIAFGNFVEGRITGRLVRQALKKWEFHSWSETEILTRDAPELTRAAADISGLRMQNFNSKQSQATRSQSTPMIMKTIKLSCAYRRVTIARDPRDPARLVVSGIMEERRYKDHKVFEVT